MAYISFQPKDYFNTKLYTGNATSRTISGIGFQPDWVWGKSRTNTEDHAVFDAVRGVTKYMKVNDTGVESNNSGLTAFNSDGYVIGTADTLNSNSQNFVTWNWKANGQGSSNTDGTINSTYTSASTTSGFSIVTYTGTNTLGATVGHGLGVAPKMIIVKSRTGGGENWNTYHASLGATKFINLNTNNSVYTDVNAWNNTAPTASVFSIGGNSGDTGRSGQNYVAYCFADVQGYSKFGSYVGNGEPSGDAPFIYTGFKPALVMIKSSSYDGQHWSITDNKRLGYNGNSAWLKGDASGAELTNLVNPDFLSNGFKLQNNNDIYNKNGQTYIYMAFAEAPLVGSNNVPATAR